MPKRNLDPLEILLLSIVGVVIGTIGTLYLLVAYPFIFWNVPIGAQVNYYQVRSFAHLVALFICLGFTVHQIKKIFKAFKEINREDIIEERYSEERELEEVKDAIKLSKANTRNYQKREKHLKRGIKKEEFTGKRFVPYFDKSFL